MTKQKVCYRCGKPAKTREHVPPKAFFPKGGSLQLKTVPSCEEHNNKKCGDDQYLLAHICMNAAAGDNLPKSIFVRSIVPQLGTIEKFRRSIVEGSEALSGGARKYKVKLQRFDNFFDHLSCALYFDKFGTHLDSNKHLIKHFYLSLKTEDPFEISARKFLKDSLDYFFEQHEEMIKSYEADKISEIVYQNKIIAPLETEGSITIAHTFYGVFNVVSLLSYRLGKRV